MNNRFNMRAAANYVQSLPDFSGLIVDTSYAHDYISRFPKETNNIWFVGQESTRIDDGRGYSGIARQYMRVKLSARIVLPRFIEGVVDAEPLMTTVHDKLTTALFGWTPPGVEEPFVNTVFKDGIPFQSVVVADLVFEATVVYVRQS